MCMFAGAVDVPGEAGSRAAVRAAQRAGDEARQPHRGGQVHNQSSRGAREVAQTGQGGQPGDRQHGEAVSYLPWVVMLMSIR